MVKQGAERTVQRIGKVLLLSVLPATRIHKLWGLWASPWTALGWPPTLLTGKPHNQATTDGAGRSRAGCLYRRWGMTKPLYSSHDPPPPAGTSLRRPQAAAGLGASPRPPPLASRLGRVELRLAAAAPGVTYSPSGWHHRRPSRCRPGGCNFKPARDIFSIWSIIRTTRICLM